MADEATDVNDDLDLGQALLDDQAEATSTEESSTTETKEQTQAEATDEKSDKDADTKEETEETTEQDDSDDTNADGQPKKRDAETRKSEIQQEIRELVAQRNELRAEVEARYEQTYRTNTVDELVDDGMEPEEAELAVKEQQHEMRVEQDRVFQLNQNIDLEVAQVMQDFPWADPENVEYDESVAKLAYDRLQKWGRPEIDENTGLVRNMNVMPYEIYEAFNETRLASSQAGAVAGQKAQAKMLATAEPRSSAPNAPSSEDDDPFLAGFNKVK